MKCSNSKCDKDPLHSVSAVCITLDGDYACDNKCEAAFIAQRDHFLDNIVHSECATMNWLMDGSNE